MSFSYRCVSSGPVAPCVWLLAWPNSCVRLALHNTHGFDAHIESQSAHCQCSMWNRHLPVCIRAAVTLSPPYTRLGTPSRPRDSQDVDLGLTQLWRAGLTPVELVPHSAVQDFQQRLVVLGCLHPISPSSEGFSAEKGYVEASPPSERGRAVPRPLPSPLCC